MSLTFNLIFVAAAPFWLLMIVAPAWSWTRRIVSSPWIPVPTLAFWFGLVLPHFGPLLLVVLRPTLQGWEGLFTAPAVYSLVWAQIIAWDLFVGRWIYLDSRKRGINPVIMAPVLVLAIMLSPVAMPLYLLLRLVVGKKPAAADAESQETAPAAPSESQAVVPA